MAIKRLIDILGAGLGLLVALPIMVVVAVLVALFLGSPVLFRQQRIGRNGRLFDMLKFRTMTDARDEAGKLLPDEARSTGLGETLRRFRLDELPELVTVLKGDMSLVGPRPLPPYILDPHLEIAAEGTGDKRAQMRPGLTGYAQVCGGTLLTMDEKMALDGWYVDHWSLGLDFWVILSTLGVVVTGERRNESRIAGALSGH